MAQLDLHRISFSDHGGRPDFYLSGWRQEPYLIHNSTALLGPAFVEFLRTASLDTQHIDAVIKAMGALLNPHLRWHPHPSLRCQRLFPMLLQATLSCPDERGEFLVFATFSTSCWTCDQRTADVDIRGCRHATAAATSGSRNAAESGRCTTAPRSPCSAVAPPIAPVVLPPAPLPPAPLPPPLLQTTVDEDALWDELS